MANYLLFHLDGGRFGGRQILGADSMALLHDPAVVSGPDVAYAMGWAVWTFDDAVLPGAAAPPVALSHGGKWLGFNNIVLLIPEYDFGLVLLTTGHDSTNSSAFSNIAFEVALVALGLEPAYYPLQEDFLTRHLRPISTALILLMVAAAVVAWRKLRRPPFARQDIRLFAGLALIDLALFAYILLVRLPGNQTTVAEVIRFEPDMGILLLLILLLTAGWGSLRSLWAIRRWTVADGD
jgi:hypothetical protein